MGRRALLAVAAAALAIAACEKTAARHDPVRHSPPLCLIGDCTAESTEIVQAASDNSAPAPSPAVAPPADPSPGALQAAVDGGTLIDAELLPFYLRAAAACEVGEFDVEPSCPEYQRYATSRRRAAPRPDLAAYFGSVGRQHLGHAKPVVRMLAGQLAVADLGPSLEPLLRAIELETDPLVARALIRLVMRAGRLQPEALQQAAPLPGSQTDCSAAWGEKPCQRNDLGQWASYWWQRAKGPEQLLVRAEAAAQWAEALVELTAKDAASPRVAAGCVQLGGAVTTAEGPEQAVLCAAAGLACPAAVGELLSQNAAPPQVVEHCIAGALQSWCRAPAYDTAQLAGYALVLAELRRQPRDDQRPSWRWIQALTCARPLFQPPLQGEGDLTRTWRKRATFVSLPDVLGALRQVVEDPKAGGHARAEALRTARDLGAPPAWLQAWKARWGRAEFGAEGQLKRALQP